MGSVWPACHTRAMAWRLVSDRGHAALVRKKLLVEEGMLPLPFSGPHAY